MIRNLFTSNFRVLTIPLCVVAVFLLVEVIFRLVYFGPAAVIHPLKYNPFTMQRSALFIYSDDPGIGKRLAPNRKTIFKGARFTTNEFGYRERAVTLKKPVDTFRLAVLGRSFSMGFGVDDDEVYSRRLELLLNDYRSEKYQVLNFAVGGYNLNQSSLSYEKHVRQFDPDMIILPIYPGEIESMLPIKYNRPPVFSWLNFRRAYLRAFFTYEMYRKWYKKNINVVTPRGVYKAPKKKRRPTVNAEEVLFEFLERRRAEGVPVVIVVLPKIEKVYDKQKVLKIKEVSDTREGVHFINVYELLGRKLDRSETIYPGDHHPNAGVHQLYAEHIFSGLKEILPAD
ncbi:MAG: SGNH/GDSL hydrolase family protein [Deltaproteobacteria bacterium]|nr:SGNH/GDSL hydrolase family protein [Deltaproteobacteria bacterium]